MSNALGLDIGGTKIAGAIFDEQGREAAQITMATPDNYDSFLDACHTVVAQLEQRGGKAGSLGLGICGIFDQVSGVMGCAANLPFLSGMPVRPDLEKKLGQKIQMGSDANCAALAEAMEGAGKNHRSVFGLIIGTGVGGGLVIDGQIFAGANGLCGDIGHLPLPFYEESDGERVSCACGQKGCIEKLIAGAALARLYHSIVGRAADGKEIAEQARSGEKEAQHVLDHYYTTVAKAMVVIMHSFDPDIITVSGGLNALPGLYEEVPKRWGKYALAKKPVTKFVPATFGALAGLRGAAWLGRNT